MKKRNQKRYDPVFKARVALEALQEDESLAQLGHQHGVHPVLVGQWKKQLKENVVAAFERGGGREAERVQQELLRRIGELTVKRVILARGLAGRLRTTGPAGRLPLGCKQRASIERASRLLKSGIPHVSLTMAPLLLQRLAEGACEDTWRNIRDDLRQVKRAQLSTPNGEVWQVTEPGPGAAKRLKQRGFPHRRRC
jgi:transposase-like protein